MADYTNVSRGSSTGWILGVIAAVAVLLFVLLSFGMSPSSTTSPDGTEPAAVAPEAVPSGAEPAATDPAATAPAASE